jgi:cellobiose-specific phosphotransferase system component IIC
MPFTVAMDKELSKIINWTGVCVFPICLTISLPVILHNLVNEKEQRLVQNMKINGMKMRNYWIVSGVYYYGIYLITIIVYLFFGRYVCELNVFTDTHMGLYFELLGCWGLC